MDALLVGVAVLLGLAALLAVPVDLAFDLEGIDPFRGGVGVRWLLGLVRFRIPVPGAGAPPRERPAEPEVAPAKRRRRGRGRGVLAALRQAAFRRRVGRLVVDLLGATHPRGLSLRVRLGLGDPADTGRLWALLGPVGAVAGGLRGAEVRIEPEFLDPVLEFEARGRLRLLPLQILALAIAFALSPPSIRAWRALGSGRA